MAQGMQVQAKQRPTLKQRSINGLDDGVVSSVSFLLLSLPNRLLLPENKNKSQIEVSFGEGIPYSSS